MNIFLSGCWKWCETLRKVLKKWIACNLRPDCGYQVNIWRWFYYALFCLLIKKASLSWKKNSRFSCQDTQNGVKRPEKRFKKISRWMFELIFGMEVKPKCPFLQYNFCRNWLADWNFVTFWIFRKMSVKTPAAANFKQPR